MVGTASHNFVPVTETDIVPVQRADTLLALRIYASAFMNIAEGFTMGIVRTASRFRGNHETEYAASGACAIQFPAGAAGGGVQVFAPARTLSLRAPDALAIQLAWIPARRWWH